MKHCRGIPPWLCAATWAAAALAPAALAQSINVYPRLNGVALDGNIATATWGYDNQSGSAVFVPIGVTNFFSPPPGFRGQPVNFQVGTHDGAFTTSWDITTAPTLTWTLLGRTVTAVAAPEIRNFTYQGQFTSGGAPVDGPVDMRFTLWDSAGATTPLAGPIALEGTAAVNVTHGLFTVTLDFGLVFDHQERLLQIEARYPSGQGNYVTLGARTPLKPAPQSLYALSAGTVDWTGVANVPANVSSAFSPWAAATGGIAYPGGYVGIGLDTPTAPLHVRSATQFSTVTFDSTDSSGTWFGLQNLATNGRSWGLISTGPANSEGPGVLLIRDNTALAVRMMIDTAGNVGIGTSLPTQRLTVNGNVLANNVVVPSSARFKEHVAPIADALGKLAQLEGVTFDWKPEQAAVRGGRVHDVGFIAEDVARVFPEVVFTDDAGHVTALDYSRLTAVAVEAIKQQQTQRAADHAELARLKAENAELRERLERIERRLTSN